MRIKSISDDAFNLFETDFALKKDNSTTNLLIGIFFFMLVSSYCGSTISIFLKPNSLSNSILLGEVDAKYIFLEKLKLIYDGKLFCPL